jgi:hypothetical protein
MYALKRRAIRDGVYPKKSFPIPVLAREFYNMVTWLVLKTNLLKFFGMAGLGLGLLRTGRFSLKSESIERREELKKLLDTVGSAK